jgi:hypothetical protein
MIQLDPPGDDTPGYPLEILLLLDTLDILNLQKVYPSDSGFSS